MKRLIAIAIIASTAAACADPKEAYNRGAHLGTAQALVDACSGWLEINDITASVYIALALEAHELPEMLKGMSEGKDSTATKWAGKAPEKACEEGFLLYGPVSIIPLVRVR